MSPLKKSLPHLLSRAAVRPATIRATRSPRTSLNTSPSESGSCSGSRRKYAKRESKHIHHSGLHADAACGRDSRKWRIRDFKRDSSRVQHSQTTSTFQPRCLRAFTFLRSLSTFPPRFFSQKLLFVAGRTRPYLHRCICQKQPWTKITL
jgi:hypothetical protein